MDAPGVLHLTPGGPAESLSAGELARRLADPAVRVLIISGIAGEAVPPSTAGEVSLALPGLPDIIEESGCPVIAVIDRPLDGFGTELALAAHWRIGTPAAGFRRSVASFSTSGFHSGPRSTRLARLLPPDRVLEMVLCGGELAAPAALDAGLLQHLAASPLAAFALARSLAARLAALSPVAIRLGGAALRQGLHLPLAAALALETLLFVQAIQSPDAREGIQAFFEKRSPSFNPVDDSSG